MKSRIVFEILTIGVIVCLIIWNVQQDSANQKQAETIQFQGGLIDMACMYDAYLQDQIDSLKTITAGYGEISLYAYAMAKKGRK